MSLRTKAIAAASSLLVFAATAANADIQHFEATLKSADAHDRGDLTAVVDSERLVLEYTANYPTRLGPVTAAGFGPVADPTDPIVTAPLDPKARTIHAVVTLTPAQFRDLSAGRWRFSLTTVGGELAGPVRRTSIY